jgi:hypothetical protein
VAQGLAPRVLPVQTEVRWQLLTIDQCCARLQMVLRQLAQSSRFSNHRRPIGFAR